MKGHNPCQKLYPKVPGISNSTPVMIAFAAYQGLCFQSGLLATHATLGGAHPRKSLYMIVLTPKPLPHARAPCPLVPHLV